MLTCELTGVAFTVVLALLSGDFLYSWLICTFAFALGNVPALHPPRGAVTRLMASALTLPSLRMTYLALPIYTAAVIVGELSLEANLAGRRVADVDPAGGWSVSYSASSSNLPWYPH